LDVRAVSSVDLPEAPTEILLTPDARELYILTPATRTVLIMHTATRRVTHQLRSGATPRILRAAPDGSHVFVGCQDSIIDISTADKKTVAIPTARVEDLAVTGDSRSVYLAMGTRGLQKMDIQTRRIAVVNAVPLVMALVLTPDGRFLYVNYQGGGPGGSIGHDAIGKFDARRGVLLRSVTGLANVGDRLAISPDGRFLWASGLDACFSRGYDHIGCPVVPAGIVNVVDTRTDKLVRSIPWVGGSFPLDLTFSPDGKILVMSGAAPRFFDSRTFEILAGLPELFIQGLAFSPDGAKAYAAVPDRQLHVPAQGGNRIAVLQITR
jgi:DNA-binding beta-propeller fold protein YncE